MESESTFALIASRRGVRFGVLRMLIGLFAGWGSGRAQAAESVLVFAAASLADSLTEVAKNFEAETGCVTRLNFGGSGTLVRQVEAGAPADIIFTADETSLDRLVEENLILLGSRRTVLVNTLVVVVPSDGKTKVEKLEALTQANVDRIAIGDPALVPAGTYAQAWLRERRLWDVLQPKLIPLGSVRAVLAAVAAGNAVAGFVYMTDARIDDRVMIGVRMPMSEGPRITYPAAVVIGAPHEAAALAWLDYLATPPARAIFTKYGFLPPPNGTR